MYVEANYHPHDNKSLDKIKSVVRLIKEARFNVFRLGYLACDRNFDDSIMDTMNLSETKVILDIALCMSLILTITFQWNQVFCIQKKAGKRSTIITTNLAFDRWGEIVKDKVLVAAMVDRLTHKAYLINMNGQSIGLKKLKKCYNLIKNKYL